MREFYQTGPPIEPLPEPRIRDIRQSDAEAACAVSQFTIPNSIADIPPVIFIEAGKALIHLDRVCAALERMGNDQRSATWHAITDAIASGRDEILDEATTRRKPRRPATDRRGDRPATNRQS